MYNQLFTKLQNRPSSSGGQHRENGGQHGRILHPHWGYMVEGELLVKYDDGREETLTAGDVFYMPPGHTAIVIKDMKLLDFSPEKELDMVLGHIAKKMAEYSK